MYRIEPRGTVSIGVGGSASDFVPVAELTASGIAHNAEGSTPAPTSIEKGLPPQPARAGRLTPGIATYQLIADEANEAVLDAEAAAEAGASRFFREQFGNPERVIANTAGVTVAIDATERTVTLGGSATPAVSATFGTTLVPAAPWDVGLMLVLGGVGYGLGRWEDGAAKARVFRIGAVASGVVTPDSVALADVPANATWELHKWAVRYAFSGVVTQAPGHDVGADSVTKSIQCQLAAFEQKTFILGS